MLKKRSFWIGVAVGLIIGFLYGWFGIWATYIDLERQNKDRETRLQKIERIILSVDTIEQERLDIIEWNCEHIQPGPTVVVAGEDNQ